MRIGRILCPVRELGPGERLGIWVQGCARECPGCANPELQSFDNDKEIPMDILSAMTAAAIIGKNLTGITITGGEPMLQAKELAILLRKINPLCNDVLIFTGFHYEELLQCSDPDIHEVLSMTSVLVDGEYIREKNTGARLRGSANQRIIYLDESRREKYEQYINAEDRLIDHFITAGGVVSVGIHPQKLLDDMQSIIKPAERFSSKDLKGGIW